MKLFLAGCIAFIGTVIGVVFLMPLLPAGTTPLLAAFLIVLPFFGLLIAVYLLFNRTGTLLRLPNNSVQLLEEQGLLQSAHFEATRAFQVMEFEDEGDHFFIEIKNGSVLYLGGQYLDDYIGKAESGCLEKRQFPCTRFAVRRHKASGDGIDVLCDGDLLIPEFVAPPFDEDDFKQKRVPDDGQLITHKTYDELKLERQKRNSTD